jgi:hypothetical protein
MLFFGTVTFPVISYKIVMYKIKPINCIKEGFIIRILCSCSSLINIFKLVTKCVLLDLSQTNTQDTILC